MSALCESLERYSAVFRGNERRIYSMGRGELSSDRILTLFVDSRGFVWIGTEGAGLNRLDPGSGSIRVYWAGDGLPHNNVQAITEDAEGRLWILTNDGVARLDVERDEFRVYRESAGILGNRFFANDVYRSPDGEIYFAGESGVTIIDPP